MAQPLRPSAQPLCEEPSPFTITTTILRPWMRPRQVRLLRFVGVGAMLGGLAGRISFV